MKRKSLLIAIAAISLAALVGLGTSAEFSDTQVSDAQTFTAGTLDLTVAQGATTPALTVTDAAPGGSGSTTLVVSNAGTVAGELLNADLTSLTASDLENTCTEPELDDADFAADPGEDNCAVPGNGGELDDNLSVTIKEGATTLWGPGTLSTLDAAGVQALAGGLAKDGDAGDSRTLTIEWSVPTTAGNDIQSDSAAFTLTFRLEQFD